MVSNEERTGVRDMRLSEKLRSYGMAYMTDIDGLFLCFDFETPVALMECKHMNITDVVKMSKRPQVLAQRTLANNSSIGLYYVVYNPERWIWYVAPMNAFAVEGLGTKRLVKMSDADFYRFQCKLRNKMEAKQFSEDKDWCHPELESLLEKYDEEVEA